MAVAGGTFLIAPWVGLTKLSLSSTMDFGHLRFMHPVDPDGGKIGDSGQVGVGGQQRRLEATHLANQSTSTRNRLTARGPAHRRVTSQAVGVIHILVPGETTTDGLANQTGDAVPAVPAGSAVGQNITGQCGQPEDFAEFTAGDQTGI